MDSHRAPAQEAPLLIEGEHMQVGVGLELAHRGPAQSRTGTQLGHRPLRALGHTHAVLLVGVPGDQQRGAAGGDERREGVGLVDEDQVDVAARLTAHLGQALADLLGVLLPTLVVAAGRGAVGVDVAQHP